MRLVVLYRHPFQRYATLYLAFLRVSLIREMMFRWNFVVRVATHVIWFATTIALFEVLYLHTNRIGDWDRHRYLIFLGTFITINGAVNAFFIGNCAELGELIRSGSLDFALLNPVDEQFLLTCRRIDWALVPQIFSGLGVAGYGIKHLGVSITASHALTYAALLILGIVLLYSLLLVLASISFWIIQHRELFEIWFLLLQFSNYPDEIYTRHTSRYGIGLTFSYLMPMVVAINVPAKYGAFLMSGWAPIMGLVMMCVAAVVMSRCFFRMALKRYASAGS